MHLEASANASNRKPAGVLKKLIFALLMTVGFFAGVEGLLALLGVEKVPAVPIVIRGEESQDTTFKKGDEKVIIDPELLWRFAPNAKWGGVRINEHGYRTRPFTMTKTPGTRRVVALGDSCTAQGEPPYSDRLHAMLQKQPPTPEPWEAFNLGVFGYSIEQGYRQFQKVGSNLQADVVTIYFGWNDHWLYDKPDRLRLATRLSPAQARVARILQSTRLFGWLARRIKQNAPARPVGARGFRVPPEHYTETLSNLVTAIRAVGALPLTITGARRELTEALVKTGHADDPDEAEQAHDQYLELTRSLAGQLDVPVLDLARDFAGPEYDAYFSRDGIHFERDGLQAIAQRLHARLKDLAEAGQLPPIR
jgi:lysophospholipase L1-like esterase